MFSYYRNNKKKDNKKREHIITLDRSWETESGRPAGKREERRKKKKRKEKKRKGKRRKERKREGNNAIIERGSTIEKRLDCHHVGACQPD